MLGKLIAAALLAGSASAHVALWDKGMFGYNYPYQADDPSNNNYNNDISVHPLRQADNLQTDQWFGHGYKGYPPKAGEFMELPSGGTYNGELGCNRADTTMRDPLRTDPLPQYACDGEGALHTVNRFNATVDPKWFGGSALAIAYTSDVASLQPNDLTVISVNHYSVWNRVTPYAIPSGMPPCPSGGCLCTWNWIHMANHGEGYGQEIYNNLYRCTVTGKTDSTKVVQKGSIPVDCSADSSKCVKGPKTPMYVYQASGNNMPNTDTPPTYTDGFGFFDGAQNDVFELAATPVSSGSTQPTATSLPTGWSALGCYVDQDPRSLPVFFSSTTNNTIQSCVAGCASNGYIYAGVEGAECWCSGPNPTLVAATSGCNKPCGGDGWATCGGDWRLNVYKAANAPATITPTSTVVPTAYPTASLPAGWSAVGCLMDSATSRTLDRGMTQYSDLTVAKCIALAESKGLPYAGVQYGKECWLGDAASSENFVQADGCNVPCGGDSGTLCGGSYRLNAYVNNALISSSSAVATATTTSSLYIASSTSKSASTSPAASSTKLASTSPAAMSTKPATSTTPPATKTAAISASSVSTSTSAPTLPSGWQALGCQGDSGGSSRMLKGVQINSNSMTPQMCMSLCSSRGYKYAGVEYGTQCFCGATVELAPRSSGCTSACGGDKSQMCGGAYRLNLYENTAVSKRALDGDEKAEKRRRDGHAGHGHGHARRNMLRFGRLGMDREGLGLH